MKIYLQLFAASATSTQGGSTSHSEGGSSSHTSSHSETDTHTEGQSHSYSYGKQWASGQVEDNTKEHRDRYNTDYVEGQKVTDAYDRLQETIDKKPTFESQYQSKLDDLYEQIMSREKFNYNFNADPMYQMYKDKYTQQGKRAMEDTMGQAASLTGGYGSSYSQSAAQQTYQNHLQELNNMIPTLRDQAYQQYRDEGNDMLNKYNVTADAYNREYGEYRDAVSDWQADRSFNYGMYSDERNFDYNQFAQERNYWNDEYWKEKNSEWSNYQVTDTYYSEDSHSETNAESQTDSSFWENANTSNWSNSATMTGAGGGGGGTAAKVAGAKRNIDNWYANNQTSVYTDMTHQNKANTEEEARARYGVEAVGDSTLDSSKLAWNSVLKNEDKKVEIMTELQNASSAHVDDTLEDLAVKYDLTKKDVDTLTQWLRRVRSR